MTLNIRRSGTPGTASHFYSVNLGEHNIKVTDTKNAFVVSKWIYFAISMYRPLINDLVIGLGVQWSPGGKHEPASTLQLCIGHQATNA
ncbi:hypothetical protein K1719_024455 [Acacia pycnantha]|nr:hypothetical protein K1719_024455 [Acacia pycnantha]